MKKTLCILGVCIALIINAGSCAVEEQAASALMMGHSSRALAFLDGRAVGEDEIRFTFSQPVKLMSANFVPAYSVDSINYIDDGATALVKFCDRLPPGILLTADILAEDENRNTINVIVPLRARNNRMPKMVINEVRTENSSPRCEFIEFAMNSSGNLGGMRVFIFGNTNAAKKTVYEFSPAEVNRGEYVMLNLRTPEAECKDEYGANLAESGGANASPTSRDFWIPGSTKLIHKTSVVYVLDQDDNVLASIMMSESPDDLWKRSEFEEAAEFLFSKGAWKSVNGGICSPAQAVITAGTTATRTICRDETVENSNTALDWYISATSGHTPGKANDPRRYNP